MTYSLHFLKKVGVLFIFYLKIMTTVAKTDLLLLDDWGLAPLNESQRRDLLELFEDRHNL
ncbi:ATP-binding protein, partial [Salinisphaera sp. G21_0]|nr:ATP-binding protein [Salinisphaera sp. G21_0]